jgi:hypothetical protein
MLLAAMASWQDATRCNSVGSVVSINSGEWCCGHVAVLGCGVERERKRGKEERKRGKVKGKAQEEKGLKVMVSIEPCKTCLAGNFRCQGESWSSRQREADWTRASLRAFLISSELERRCLLLSCL